MPNTRKRTSTGLNIAPNDDERELINEVRDMVAAHLKVDRINQKSGIMWAVRIAKYAMENNLIASEDLS